MVLQSSRYADGAVLPQPPRLAVGLVRIFQCGKKTLYAFRMSLSVKRLGVIRTGKPAHAPCEVFGLDESSFRNRFCLDLNDITVHGICFFVVCFIREEERTGRVDSTAIR